MHGLFFAFSYLVQKTQILSLWYFFWVCVMWWLQFPNYCGITPPNYSHIRANFWVVTLCILQMSQVLQSYWKNANHFLMVCVRAQCQNEEKCLCSALKISHYAQIQFHNAQNNIISERVCILGFFAGNYDLNFKHGVCVWELHSIILPPLDNGKLTGSSKKIC